MNNNISIWNGYPIHGDINELNRIAEANGFVNLNKDDVVEVLSVAGENYVVAGTGDKINEAFDNAVNNLPCSIDCIDNLLISFHCGRETRNSINDIAKISSALSGFNKEISVTWGIASDNSLAGTFKVVLVASCLGITNRPTADNR